MNRQSSRHVFCIFIVFVFSSLVWGPSCNCESESIRTGLTLQIQFEKPKSGAVAGDVPFHITVKNSTTKKELETGEFKMVEVFIQPLGKSVGQQRIAELHHSPFTFEWNSVQVEDGFYILKAKVWDSEGGVHESKRTLIQVVNTAPELWFVNCGDGQFVRGVYSLVVSLHRPKAELKGPPTLSINGLQGPKTTDRKHPYRFEIDTRTFQEGEFLSLAVRAEDLRGNARTIVCRPRVDNVRPTVRFVAPKQNGALISRSFEVSFSVFDLFGVKEVRLWVDGSACPQTRSEPDPSCSKKPAWVGVKAPFYPIQVDLTNAYKTEQTILLTARAVDQAGNLSDPPAKLRIRVDPVLPEIFIRAPGQGELIQDTVTFSARITDNDTLKRVFFRIEGAKGDPIILDKRPNTSEVTLSLPINQATRRFGRGQRYLVVTAEDASGNRATARRLFNIGCSSAADCPVGKVCHAFECKVPAGLNQPCDKDRPCALQTACVPGKIPLCSESPKTFCRKRCHPGNKVVPPDPCARGFYCDKRTLTCMPTDQCLPLRDTCKSNEQCVPLDDDSNICIPTGSVRPGGRCDGGCGMENNCGRGFWCVFNQVSGGNTCMQACDSGDPSTCPSGQQCLRLRWSFGGAPLRYGICVQ